MSSNEFESFAIVPMISCAAHRRVVEQRSVDVNDVRSTRRRRSVRMKATGMLLPNLLHHRVSLSENVGRATKVHVGRREKRESAVTMFVVVPGHEVGA